MIKIGGDHFLQTAGHAALGQMSHWYSRELRFVRSLALSVVLERAMQDVRVGYLSLGLDSREFGYLLQRMVTGWGYGDQTERPSKDQIARWYDWEKACEGNFSWWAPRAGESWEATPYKEAIGRMRTIAKRSDILVVDSYPNLRDSYTQADISPSFTKASMDICKAVRNAARAGGSHVILLNQGTGDNPAGGNQPSATAAFTVEASPGPVGTMTMWVRSSKLTGRIDAGVVYEYSGEDRLFRETSLAETR